MKGRRVVHSLMCYNLEPDAIITLCYNELRTTVAALRNNNRIELWNVSASPFLQSTILLNTDHKLRSVCWSGDRLFGADLQGFVREYDVRTLHEKASRPVTSGACHCIAVSKDGSRLAAGTEAGYINIFNIYEDDIVNCKLLECRKKILSICWDQSDGKYVAAGSVGKILIFNIEQGSIVHELRLPRQTKKVEVIVWCLAFSKDLSIISGDSSGTMRVWDGKTGTCAEEFHDHKADILSLTLGEDQNDVYTTGVDTFVVRYRRHFEKGGKTKWLRSGNYTCHSHDVNSIIAIGDGKLCTGGVDANLIVSTLSPALKFQRYPPLLQNPSVSASEESRCVLLRYPKHLELWQLTQPTKLPTKLLELRSCSGKLIRSSDVSGDLKFIAYSANKRFKLFKFHLEPELRLEDFPLKGCSIETVHHIRFSSDNKHLVLADSCSTIQVFDTDNFDLSYSIDLSRNKEMVSDRIVHLAVSRDGKYIATAGTKGQLVIWSEGKHYSTVPRYSKPVTAIAFHPFKATEEMLYAVYSDYLFVEYSVGEKRYTDFTRTVDMKKIVQYMSSHSLPVTKVSFDEKRPDSFILQNSTTICAVNKARVISQWNGHKRKRRDSEFEDKSPNETKAHVNSQWNGHKRMRRDSESEDKSGNETKRRASYSGLKVPPFVFRPAIKYDTANAEDPNGNLSDDRGIRVFNRYAHLVYFGPLGKNEMVAVAVKPELLLNKLPPVLRRKRFGRA